MRILSFSLNAVKNLPTNNNNGSNFNKGFTLIEMIVVFAIIAILTAIAGPSYISCVEKSRKTVCDTNCTQLKRIYEIYLTIEDLDHNDDVFNQYIQEYGRDICPNGGDMRYSEHKVQCSVHAEGALDKNDGTVPFL